MDQWSGGRRLDRASNDDAVIDVDGTTELAGCSDNVVRHAPMQVSSTGFAVGLAP